MRSQEPFRTTKFAILLSGCGNKDGSEIIEAATCITGLSRRHAEVQCFSIDRDQMDVVNHRDGKTTQERRNMFVEASRIARGNLKEMKELNAKDFDGLVIPGGFGIAKNFSDFATKGADMKVDEQVEKVILDFYNSNKVIGACCIAPILLARIFGTKFGGPGLTITLGREGPNWPYSDAIRIAEEFGNNLERKDSDFKCIDFENGIVTTPAYMNAEATFANVDRGINEMIFSLIKSLH